MITNDLIAYIQAQLDKNIPKDIILNKLLEVGWKLSDIEEGFQKFTSASDVSVAPIIPKTIDPYRELTEEEEKALSIKAKQENKEEPKVKTDESLSGVWTPVKIKPVGDYIPQSSPLMTASSFKEHKVELSKVIPSEMIAPVSAKPFIFPNNTPIRSSVFENSQKSFSSTPNNWADNNLKTNIPEIEVLPSHKNRSALWMTVFLIFIIVIGGLTFAFMKGYIKIDNMNIPFIKKDPKVLLLNNKEKLSSLKSYKTETNINISSPSFANITNSLISGDEVSSIDRDSVSLKSLSVINQENESFLSENLITITSSILKDSIVSNIKNDGSNLFVSIPKLNQIMGNDAFPQKVVLFKQGEFDQIIPMLPGIFTERLKQVNIYKILSEGVSSYITNSKTMSYEDFINNTSVIEKEEEVIRSMETYHYDININKQVSKKLLKEISSEFFASDLSDDDKANLDEVLGTVNITSFEVWIGKNDDNIYQYKINISIPLSKVLNLEDGSIGDSEVKLDWTTTYYDFNIVNEITIPQDFITASDFIKSSNDIRLKNKIISFSSMAKSLYNGEGGYGKTVNKSGSCIKPNQGSLFSPIGHTKGSSLVVGDIANTMNDILSQTNNMGFCFSTLKDWAVSFPLENEPGSYFCLDSKGLTSTLNTELKGSICN